MNTHRRLAIALLLFFGTADAASLKQAEFTRVINDVRLLQARQQPLLAKIGDKIAGQTAVSTGVASRAELQFSDKTLTRIGSNSVFRLDKADRTVDLEKGVILLQVPKQIGGAKVRTAAVTAAVTGTTVMFEYDPVSGIIKIIVLEGQVDVYLNDNPSEMRTLVAGDILMMNVADRVIPMAAKIDLELLRKTSKLMDVAEFGPLGNEKHLADALDEQGKLKQNGELLKTAFEIVGRGTQITLTNEARQEIFKTLVLQNRDPGAGGSNQGGNETPGGADGNQNGNGNGGNGTGGNATAGNGPAPQAPGSGTLPNQPILNSGTTVFGTGSSIVTNPHATAFNSLTNSIVTMQGTIYNPGTDGFFNTYMYGDAQTFPEADTFLASRGSWFVFKGDSLYISGDIAVNTTPGPRNVILGATGDVTFSSRTPFAGVATSSTWTIPSSVDSLLISSRQGSIIMDDGFSLYGTTGAPQDVAFYAYGPMSDVIFRTGGGEFPQSVSMYDGTFKAHAGRDIIATATSLEAREVKLNARRDVKLDSRASVYARTLLQIDAIGKIQIQNSSQLAALSLTDPLSILLKAVNGNIEITNSSVDATSLEAVTGGGSLSMVNSSIVADVIKARVMSTGGELLVSNSILGRDTPAASSLIKLYGEGASGVRFSGNNTLNASSVDIAGRTVTIDAGGVVRLSNPGGTRVFSDTSNFNNGTLFGSFTDKSNVPVSVTKDIYDHRPAY